MIKLSSLPKAEQAKMLMELVNTPGWQLLREFIEDGLKARAKIELYTTKHKDLASVEFLQYKITVCDTVLEFPQKIIENLQDEKAASLLEDQDDNDPYYQNVEQIEEANKKEIEDGV